MSGTYRYGEQGQSEMTVLKVGIFGATRNLIVKRAAPKLIRHGRTLINMELNSGSGYNEEAHCIGTPISFLRNMRKHPGLSFRMVCVDNDEVKLVTLRNHVKSRFPEFVNCVDYYPMDNGLFLREHCHPWLCRVVRGDLRRVVGSIICDPNGIAHGFPHQDLGPVATALPNFLVGVRYAWRDAKACHRVNCGISKWAGLMPEIRTKDFLESLNRSYWLIADCYTSRASVVIFGNNYPLPGYEEVGLYTPESPEGAELLGKIYSW